MSWCSPKARFPFVKCYISEATVSDPRGRNSDVMPRHTRTVNQIHFSTRNAARRSSRRSFGILHAFG